MSSTSSYHALLAVSNSRTRGLLSLLLLDFGCKVDGIGDAREARRLCDLRDYSVCFISRDLPENGGNELLERLATQAPDTIRVAVGEGVSPADLDLPAEVGAKKIRELLESLFARRPLQVSRERKAPPPPPPQSLPRAGSEPRHLTVVSPATQNLWQAICAAAATDGDLLLVGEPGSEFEAVAREIVRVASTVDTGPIHVDHPHVQEETLRSLDSLARLSSDPIQFILINDLPHLPQEARRELQDHLLRRRNQEAKPATRIRFILAAPVDNPEVFLASPIARDFGPLLSATVTIPALRDRAEDIPSLARETLFKLADLNPSQRPRRLDASSLAVLQGQIWRRNHEELVYVLRRAALSCTQRVLQPSHIQPHLGKNPRADNGTPVDFLMTAGSRFR